MSATSSNEWEVVTKSRKLKNLEKKVNAHTEQKRIAAQLPKLEELSKNEMLIPFFALIIFHTPSLSLPPAVSTQQYRNLFGSNDNNNSKSHSPAKSTSSTSSKSKSISPRKTKSAGETSKKQKAPTSSGPTKPKTLEQALKQITPDDLAAQVAQVKISCPGSELRWLSSVSRNQRVEGVKEREREKVLRLLREGVLRGRESVEIADRQFRDMRKRQ